jgi:hypothetical protein
MSGNFIINLWPYWIIGLIIFPVLAILPQLANIRASLRLRDPQQIVMLFLTPRSIISFVVFGMLSFVCFVLFLASAIIGIIVVLKGIFA